jgi:hypothetical protein
MEKIETSYVSRVIIPLQGGLGNQLFQLAFAMYCGDFADTFLEIDLRDPSNLKKFNQGLSKFDLPDKPKIDYVKPNHFFRKLRNYLTRLSTTPNTKYWQTFNSVIGNMLIFSTKNLHKMDSKVIVAKGVGFDGDLISKLVKRNNYIIGYFQSFKWLEQNEIRVALRKLSLMEETETLSSLRNRSKVEKPTIIHLRFGDYLNDKTFKMHYEYYNLALRHLQMISKIEHLWVFSDDEKRAREILEIPVGVVDRWIVGQSIEPAEAFEIMRLGYNYIISNSTYSYWAAVLSHQTETIVIAPAQWFNSDSDPVDLCPSEWIRI